MGLKVRRVKLYDRDSAVPRENGNSDRSYFYP